MTVETSVEWRLHPCRRPGTEEVEVMRLPIRSFVAAAAASMLVVAFAVPAAVASGPSIDLSTAIGPSATAVLVTGVGFQPGEVVDVFFDERDLSAAAAGNRGRVVDVPVEVPRGTQPGTHWFTLLGRHSGDSARAAFDVTPSTWTSWPLRGADGGRTGAQPSASTLSPESVVDLASAWDVDGWGEPLVVGRTVVLWRSAGYESTELVAIDAWTGRELWTNTGFYESSLSTWGSSLLVSSGRKVTALDLGSGAVLWSRNVGPWGSWGWGSPSVAGDVLYAAFDGRNGPRMVAYDLRALEPVWETSIAGRDRWVNDQPSVGGGVVVGAFGRGMDAFDADTGNPLWSRPNVGYVDGLVVSGDRVFVVLSQEGTLALESRVLTTGALDWRLAIAGDGSDYAYVMDPAVSGGLVVVASNISGGTPGHHLSAFDAGSGARVWERSLAVSGGPSIASDMVFVPGSDGRLHVVGLVDGRELGSVLIGVGGDRPAIANGTVYLSGWNGRLYAVRPAGAPKPDPAALVPRRSLTPDQIQPREPMTAGWTEVASLSVSAGVAATSSTEFRGSLYLGTELAPDAAGAAQIWRSEDGVTFSVTAAFPGATAVDVEAFGGRLFAATRSPGGASMASSTDGTTFSSIAGLPSGGEVERYLPVAAGSRLLVAGDTSGGIGMWWSSDGVTFERSRRLGTAASDATVVAQPFAPYEHGVVFDGMRYVGVRAPTGGELWRSEDGTTLERVPLADLGATDAVRGVEPQAVFEGSLYVVTEQAAPGTEPAVMLYRTADGASFERVTLPGTSSDPGRYASAQLGEVDGRLILVSGNRDPRRFGARGAPIQTELTHGLQVFASDDGATWRRVAEPGFGDPHDWTGALLVADGTAYLAVTNHREGDAVWRSTDGLAWQPMFREAGSTPASLGPTLTLYQGHLLLLHGDLRNGLTVYRTDEAIVATGGVATAGGWLALALAIVAATLAVGFVVIAATRGWHRPAHRGPGPMPRAT
jgi:outer membrane protein assembly factor BamB